MYIFCDFITSLAALEQASFFLSLSLSLSRERARSLSSLSLSLYTHTLLISRGTRCASLQGLRGA